MSCAMWHLSDGFFRAIYQKHKLQACAIGMKVDLKNTMCLSHSLVQRLPGRVTAKRPNVT